MSQVHDIGGGWKGMEVPGVGVIVQAEMGLILVPYSRIVEGNIVGDERPAETTTAPAKTSRAPSTIASVNVKAFATQMEGKNLTSGGEYGGIGPVLRKLLEFVQGIEPDSPQEAFIGNLLATGNHERFGMSAAVVAIAEAKRLDEFVQVLNSPEPDILEAFVDKCITGAA